MGVPVVTEPGAPPGIRSRIIALAVAAFTAAPLADAAPPPLPPTPAGIERIVYARPFTLDTGYEFEWRRERPLITQGHILVLEVDGTLVYPRQSSEPVLYAGDQTAERVNVGYRPPETRREPAGADRRICRVIAIVPGEIDLDNAPIWFGAPELPERCDDQSIAVERARADAAGISPRPEREVASSLQEGGETLKASDRHELLRETAALIKRYSPHESDLADALLVPRIERSDRPR